VFAVDYRDTEAALAAIKKPASNWQINVMTDPNTRVASRGVAMCSCYVARADEPSGSTEPSDGTTAYREIVL
jgi:hypothetical protein